MAYKYTELLDAVEAYYGSGSDQWLEIAQYGISSDQAVNILKQVPGVEITTNKAGNILDYAVHSTVPLNDGGVAASVINSNAQTGIVSAENTITTNTLGSIGVDSGTGNITATSNITKTTGGVTSTAKAVASKVSAVIAGAATGLALGKTINSALYNNNPNFWSDLVDIPEEGSDGYQFWQDITNAVDKVDPDGKIQRFVTGLVGWGDGNTSQLYIDEKALAYYAWMLEQAGAFDSGDSYAEPLSPIQEPYASLPNISFRVLPVGQWMARTSATVSGDTYINWIYVVEASDPVYEFVLQFADGSHCEWWICSKSTFKAKGVQTLSTSPPVEPPTSPRTYSASISATGGYTFKGDRQQTTISTFDQFFAPITPSNIIWSNGSNAEYYSKGACASVIYGTHHSTQPIDGLNDLDGGTTPNTSGWDNPSNTLNSLKTQYPDMWDNSYQTSVLQEDGTETIRTYVPVPMPDSYTESSQPLNDGETSNQNNPQVDPNNSTETLLKTIISLLTQEQTDPKTITDQDTNKDTENSNPNPDDTGDGNSPPTVIPTAQTSALFAVYNPTQAEINAFGQWLWSSNFIDQLLKMFNDPMQAIMGLHKTYISPATGSASTIHVGYLDSGVSSATVPTQYTTMDCGSVNLAEYFGNVFDYSPYTRVFIYLPFIGFKELDVSQVMRSSINVKYRGDAYTGACLAEITVTRDGGAGGVLYSFGGECAVRYPLSQGSYMGIATGLMGVAASATMALGGMMNPIMGIGGMLSSAMSAKTKVEQSGGFSGNVGAMGIKKPYLVVMRPQTAMPSQHKHFSGAPSSSYVTISKTNGLIRVRECHVEDIIRATKEEKTMIETALKEGVLVS